jgi:hypothetical protein
MPISFPPSPSDEFTYTEGSITWEYSLANNSWTVLTLVPAGLDNNNDHHLELIYLYNAGVAGGGLPSTNLQTPAVGLTYTPVDRTLQVKALATQLENMFELVNRNGEFLNGFNKRAVLEHAGKIYYQASAPDPVPDIADPGILWFDSDDVFLKVWSGTAWVTAAGNVTLNGTETFTGSKTFNNADLILAGTSELVGSGASKNIVIKATNSGSTETDGITVSSSQVTLHQPVELTSLTAGSKTVVATLGDAQSFTAVKTFTTGIITSSIAATSSTSAAATGSIAITASKNAASRGITIDQNSNGGATNGIQIKATNESNAGRLTITGEVLFENNITLAAGANLTGTVVGSTISYGQFGSNGAGAVDPQILNILPDNIGPFTFAFTDADNEMTITNTSTKTASIYYSRMQDQATFITAMGIRKITISGGGVAKVFADSGTVTQISGTVSDERRYGTVNNTTLTDDIPVLITVALA